MAEGGKSKSQADNPAVGSSLDDFLEEEGTLAQCQAEAAKRVIAQQVKQLVQQQGISKAQLARELNASRQTVDRLLDPEDTGLNLKTLASVADLLGKRLEIRLV